MLLLAAGCSLYTDRRADYAGNGQLCSDKRQLLKSRHRARRVEAAGDELMQRHMRER